MESKHVSHVTERAVIGACLSGEVFLHRALDRLTLDHFNDTRCRRLWRALVAVHARGHGVDTIAVIAHLGASGELSGDGEENAIKDIALTPQTAQHFEGQVEILVERYRMKMLRGYQARLESLMKEGSNSDEILAGAQSALLGYTEDFREDGFEDIAEVAVAFDNHLDAIRAGRSLPVLDAGFPRLRSRRFLQRKTLTIAAASTNVGKTDFGLNVTRGVLERGRSVGLISVEMSKSDIMRRLCSMQGGGNSATLESKDPERIQQVKDANRLVSQWPLRIWEARFLHIDRLRAFCLIAHQRRPFDLLVVDYLQLLEGAGTNRNEMREREVARMSRGLKLLAKELDIAILALAQLNRDVRDGRPRMFHIRESGRIEQDSDMTILMWRPGMVDGDISERELRLYVEKNRHAARGVVDIEYTPEGHHMEEAEHPWTWRNT